MSASREKKNRQDLSGSDWSNPKTAREAQQRKEEKRTNILYGTIGVVFLIVAIIAVIWKSNIIPKMATAATIDGEKYTAAEVNYYFQNYYTNWVNQNYYYLSYIGLDTTADLRDQTYSDDQSWFDFFMEQTLDYMTSVQALNDAAAEEGFTWDDEMQADYDKALADGSIVTGKTSSLLGASSACLLNALKALAGIDKKLPLIAPGVIEPIQHLKVEHLGNHNPRLHTDELLIALSICAVTNPMAGYAIDQLGKLRGCEAHSSVILSHVDEDLFKKLGVNITFEPKYQAKKLFHKN